MRINWNRFRIYLSVIIDWNQYAAMVDYDQILIEDLVSNVLGIAASDTCWIFHVSEFSPVSFACR